MTNAPRGESWLPPSQPQEHPQWETVNEAIYNLPKVLDGVWSATLGLVPDSRFTEDLRDQNNKLQTVREANRTIRFDIEAQERPHDIIQKLLDSVDQSFKADRPSDVVSNYSAQFEAYLRERRRCDVTINQYNCLRALNEYMETVQSLPDPNDRYNNYFIEFQQAIEAAAADLITEQACIANPDAFQKIQRVGEPISRNEAEPITVEQLVYVRAMNDHVPVVQNGNCVTTTPFRAGISGRNSIHGSLNHLVEPHSQATWQDAQGITILPLGPLAEQHQPTNATEVDTYFFGDIEFTWPEGSIIVVQAGAELWEQLLTAHPEVGQRYTVLRVTNPEAMRTATTLAMLRQGYTAIPGGDHQSSDPLIAKKMGTFRQTFVTHEGGTPHYTSAADQLDMAHGTILLQRIKQEQQNPERWADEVDWVNNQLARGQLAELVNAADTFWYNVGGADFTDYNLPETRRAELINAVGDVLKAAPDPRSKYADIEKRVYAIRDDDQLYHREDAKRVLYLSGRKLYRSYYKLKRTRTPEAEACLARINLTLDPETRTALDSWTTNDELRAILE